MIHPLPGETNPQAHDFESAAASLSSAEVRHGPSVVGTLLWAYMGLLVTGVVYGWAVHFGLLTIGLKEARNRAELIQAAVEVVNTILVLVTAIYLRPAVAKEPVEPARQLPWWLVPTAAMIAMLALNYGYHWLLLRAFPRLVRSERSDLSLLTLLLMCIQPALVEELFFRYTALGILRTVLGNHASVLVSAVMFGMAHIFALPSIPLLIALGICLGYARIYGGGLLIPIFLHFFHNLTLLLLGSGLL